jgi:hypothetical protein
MFGSADTTGIFIGSILKARDELANLYKTGDHCGVILGRWIDAVRETLQDFI